MSTMENPQHLAIESFSYSWLLNLKTSLDGVDEACGISLDTSDDEYLFIEIDPKVTPFRSSCDTQDFNFDFVVTQPLTLVHADQIFSNGLLMPLHLLTNSKLQQTTSSHLFDPISDPRESPPSFIRSSSKSMLLNSRLRLAFFQRCRGSSKRIVCKYFRFLRPLCWKVLWRRLVAHGKINSTRTKRYTESAQTTPRTSSAFSTTDLHHNRRMFASDDERSIHDAVLHCKRSVGESAL